MVQIHIIPDLNKLDESFCLAKKYNANFEYNDFFLPDVLDNKERCKEIMDRYKALDRDRSKDTLHGAFFDITIHSDDKLIREISEKRVYQSMDIAKELGVKGVVFHTNYIDNFRTPFYVENWIKRNADFYKKLLGKYPTLEVYIENMFDSDSDMIVSLAKRLQTEERFGICFDYAHACVFSNNLEKWAVCVAPFVKHMHINDNGMVYDSHMALGKGSIDWKKFNELITDNKIEASVLVEMSELEKQETSIQYLMEHHYYPFNA